MLDHLDGYAYLIVLLSIILSVGASIVVFGMAWLQERDMILVKAEGSPERRFVDMDDAERYALHCCIHAHKGGKAVLWQHGKPIKEFVRDHVNQ